MNKERLAGMRLQWMGRIRETWGQWTGDSLRANAGRRDQIIGKAQQANGIAREQADRQLKDFHVHHRNWYS